MTFPRLTKKLKGSPSIRQIGNAFPISRAKAGRFALAVPIILMICIPVLMAGCAGIAVKRESGEVIVVSEWFRSGEYSVSAREVKMETAEMSPTLAGVVAGGLAAGLPGAVAGGSVGLLSEGVDLLVDDGVSGGNP